MSVEYRDIEGFPGYRVGSDGSVWGSRKHPLNPTGEWRRLAPHRDKDGYWQIGLRRAGQRPKRCPIHRLVLEAFVGTCPTSMEALHGPCGKDDNSLSNLRWGTPVQNYADRYRDGTAMIGERNGNVRIDATTAALIRRRVAAGESQQAVGDDFGVSQSQVSRIVRREHWRHLAAAEG